jgi:Uma2 family endonuclease
MIETTTLSPSLSVAMPPTQKDLPSDDGNNMETQRHKMQMDILIETLYPWLEERSDGYVGGNMFLYFSMVQVRNQDFQGPDFFAVLDVPKGERLSWVVWEEGKAPNIVIELLSPSTAAKDKLAKKLTYQNQVRVPEYFWFDPFNPDDLAGFSLDQGIYQPLFPDAQDRFISQQLQLALVKWYGSYGGVNNIWLRWETLDGVLLPTSQENAIKAQVQAQEAQVQARETQTQVQEMQKRSQDLENLLEQYREKFGELR